MLPWRPESKTFTQKQTVEFEQHQRWDQNNTNNVPSIHLISEVQFRAGSDCVRPEPAVSNPGIKTTMWEFKMIYDRDTTQRIKQETQ